MHVGPSGWPMKMKSIREEKISRRGGEIEKISRKFQGNRDNRENTEKIIQIHFKEKFNTQSNSKYTLIHLTISLF